jgi:hypothetical protein
MKDAGDGGPSVKPTSDSCLPRRASFGVVGLGFAAVIFGTILSQRETQKVP